MEIRDNGQGISKKRLKRVIEGAREAGVGMAGMLGAHSRVGWINGNPVRPDGNEGRREDSDDRKGIN